MTEQAKRENEKRNRRVLSTVIEFAENLIKTDLPTRWITDADFKETQATSQPYIDAFKNTLPPDPNEVITCCYIFDPQILATATLWFEDEKIFDRFGGWWSLKTDLFWINGFGSLQSATSAYDAQVICKGIGNVTHNSVLPNRLLKNSKNSSYFFNASSRLGIDFF